MEEAKGSTVPARVARMVEIALDAPVVTAGSSRARAMRLPLPVVNQRSRPGPAVISVGAPPAASVSGYSVTTPAGVMRPRRRPFSSANHRLPSGPATIPRGWAPAVMPAENSVTTPAGVIRPMRARQLGEPEVVVGAEGDVLGEGAGRDAGGELGDHPRRGDPPDAALQLREPEVAVRAEGDREGPAARA